jgi:hypothetical protein
MPAFRSLCGLSLGGTFEKGRTGRLKPVSKVAASQGNRVGRRSIVRRQPMSLFDPNIIPAECGTPDYIDIANKMIELLRARKVLSISLVGVERTRNLVRSYIQAYIRRCLTFIEGGHAEFYSGRSLVAFACARANYENVAAFCDFAKNLIPLLEAGDNAAIRDFVEGRALATRVPSFVDEHGKGIEARNILTQIDHMKKKYAGYREAYDHLSDFMHPNVLGTFAHFVSIDPSTRVATFPDTGKNPN